MGAEKDSATYLCALQVHIVVSDLEMYADKVDEWDVVTDREVSSGYLLS